MGKPWVGKISAASVLESRSAQMRTFSLFPCLRTSPRIRQPQEEDSSVSVLQELSRTTLSIKSSRAKCLEKGKWRPTVAWELKHCPARQLCSGSAVELRLFDWPLSYYIISQPHFVYHTSIRLTPLPPSSEPANPCPLPVCPLLLHPTSDSTCWTKHGKQVRVATCPSYHKPVNTAS